MNSTLKVMRHKRFFSGWTLKLSNECSVMVDIPNKAFTWPKICIIIINITCCLIQIYRNYTKLVMPIRLMLVRDACIIAI